ncbi:MAG: hypothetical protein V4620_06410 [Bacteroidota bacterium]
MKKTIAILLLALYSSATIGANINLQFCADKLVAWSIWQTPEKTCTKCGLSNKQQDCCKQIQGQLKITQAHTQNNISEKQEAKTIHAHLMHDAITCLTNEHLISNNINKPIPLLPYSKSKYRTHIHLRILLI